MSWGRDQILQSFGRKIGSSGNGPKAWRHASSFCATCHVTASALFCCENLPAADSRGRLCVGARTKSHAQDEQRHPYVKPACERQHVTHPPRCCDVGASNPPWSRAYLHPARTN